MRNKNPLWIFLITPLLFSMAIATVSAQETIISVEPQSYTAGVGDIFTINVTVVNVADLYGFELKLSYNTTILNITKATIHPFLNKPTTTAKDEIHEDEGRYWLAITSYPPAEPKSGSGPLVTLTFKVTGIGSCDLHLYDIGLAAPGDDGVEPISYTTIDGKVTIVRGLWLEPSFTDNLHKCEEFSVSLMVNVTAPTPGGGEGLFGWEYRLRWNTSWVTLVSCKAVIETGDDDTRLGWHTDYIIVKNVTGTEGGLAYHWYAVTALYPAPPFTGVTWLCNYTFHIEEQPHKPAPAYTGEIIINHCFFDYPEVETIFFPEYEDFTIGTFRIQPATRSAPLPIENIAIVIVIAIFFVAALYYTKKRILK